MVFAIWFLINPAATMVTSLGKALPRDETPTRDNPRKVILNQSRCNDDNKRCNKPMDQKRPDKRSRPVGDPTEGEAAKDRGERFDFRLADVSQCKWDGLQP